MPIKQKIAIILIGLFIFLFILESVRRRKLKEEYSWLWLLTGAVIIILAFWYDLLLKISDLIGMKVPTSTLFLFALIFLVLVCLQFSVIISKLTDKIKNLAQELTILKLKIANDNESKQPEDRS